MIKPLYFNQICIPGERVKFRHEFLADCCTANLLTLWRSGYNLIVRSSNCEMYPGGEECEKGVVGWFRTRGGYLIFGWIHMMILRKTHPPIRGSST